MNYINKGDALDLGCGAGRNSFFLKSQGFNVRALDSAPDKISKIQEIIELEKINDKMSADVYDINEASISQNFDLIISTVVLQFLKADRINDIIRNLQNQTKIGGYNLIVAPLSTSKFACEIDFPFLFAENELKEYYKGWEIVKYNEEIGSFHRKKANGEFYQSLFATMIAKKV